MWMLMSFLPAVAVLIYYTWRTLHLRGLRLAGEWSEDGRWCVQPVRFYGDLKLRSLRIGVRSDSALVFSCRAETAMDRRLKRLRLAREQQLERPWLDEQLYLLTDDPRVGERLRAERRLADRVLALFDARGFDRYDVCRLVSGAGVLWVELKPTQMFSPPEGPAPAPIVAALEVIAADLAAPTEVRHRVEARRFLPALLRGASLALLVTGSAWLLASMAWPGPVYLLDNLALLPWAIVLAVVSWCVILGVPALAQVDSSRVAEAWPDILFVGGLGAAICGWALAFELNHRLDQAAPSIRETTVVEHRRQHNRRIPDTFHLRVRDHHRVHSFRLDPAAWSALAGARSATLRMHPGRLGALWAETPQPATNVDNPPGVLQRRR